MYLRDYRLRKTWLCKCLKSRVSENRSTDNMANLSKHCCDLNDSTFTKVIDHCDDSSIGKKCLLVLYNILRLFLNTLTADDKHYLLTTDNLMQPIQMQLSQKPKPFSQFFSFFLNLYEIINICQQRITVIADLFPEILTPKNMAR